MIYPPAPDFELIVVELSADIYMRGAGVVTECIYETVDVRLPPVPRARRIPI